MRTHLIAASLIALIGATPAHANEYATGPFATEIDYVDKRWDATEVMSSGQALGLMRAVELSIDDQVDLGCWTNRDAVYDRVRSELVMAGITVHTEPLESYDVLSPEVRVSLLGYQMAGGACVASMTLDVNILARHEMGSLTYTGTVFNISGETRLWGAATLISGQTVDALALETSARWMERLINDIRIARNDPKVQAFNNVWPKAQPRTAAQAQ